MDDMVATLWNSYVVLMAIGAWFIVWVVQKVFPVFNTNRWLKKFKPLYAVALCQGFVWIPGALADGASLGERILVGFWCGFLASFGYQIAKRVLEPKGINLPENPDALTQVITSTTETSKTETKIETPMECVSPEPESNELTPAETPTSKSATPAPKPVEPEKND